jgi:hypothetical protein
VVTFRPVGVAEVLNRHQDAQCAWAYATSPSHSLAARAEADALPYRKIRRDKKGVQRK